MKTREKTNKGKTILSGLLAKVILVVIATVTVITSVVANESVVSLFANKQIVANADGNATSEISMANVLETFDYEFADKVQRFTIEEDGYYKLEAWGAQGQNGKGSSAYSGYYGGKGAYATGTIYLTEGTELFIYVGGTNGYNGGGQGALTGGGASDIRIDSDSLYSRVLVAAGGGAGAIKNIVNDSYNRAAGGETSFGSYPATQTTPGYSANFGSGATPVSYSGGGGGWFGGGAESTEDGNTSGGSSYAYIETAYRPDEYLLDSSYYLTNTALKSGIDSFKIPNIDDYEIGHSGNGYVRISRIDKDKNIPNSMEEGKVFEYGLTHSTEKLKVPVDGRYKLQVWGAQGSGNGGKGGYSEGIIDLYTEDELYIRVGGRDGFNGGGTGTTPGGGATDIRINADNLYNRAIVAGGGGGGGGISGRDWGGAAGGITGYVGHTHKDYYSSEGYLTTPMYAGTAGTQTSGHAFGQGSNSYTNTYRHEDSRYYSSWKEELENRNNRKLGAL